MQILFFFNLTNKFIENKLLIGLNNNSFMKNNLQNTKAYIDKKIDWPKIQSTMKVKFGNEIYESWIKKINLVDEFKSYILLSVSTRFIRDWITSRYLDQILQIVRELNKEIIRIEFIIQDNNLNDEKQNLEVSRENIIKHQTR